MNKLEELSKKNKENYQRYLRRMTESMKYSTKGLIPLLAISQNNVLDVGCGSGVMLNALETENPKVQLTGLDLNEEAIKKLMTYDKGWKLYHMDFMDLEGEKFDGIIFSSILHEISSYNDDPTKRFTKEPILRALKKSYDLLEEDGIVVVRDGILQDKKDRDRKVIVSFKEPSDGIWLYRFMNDFRGFDNLDVDKSITSLAENKYLVSEGFLKEFLSKYTWGEESYPREINERFGILTRDEWINLLKLSGFKIETTIEAKEEYEKYLQDRITILDESGNPYEYPDMSITLKARKIKSLNKHYN